MSCSARGGECRVRVLGSVAAKKTNVVEFVVIVIFRCQRSREKRGGNFITCSAVTYKSLRRGYSTQNLCLDFVLLHQHIVETHRVV